MKLPLFLVTLAFAGPLALYAAQDARIRPRRGVFDGGANQVDARKMDERLRAYVERVKSGIRAQWRPHEVLRSIDPKGQRYGYKDRYTLLEIEVDPEGWALACRVKQVSLVPALDNHVITACHAAQPFGPPPPEHLDRDRRLKFQLGLYVDMPPRRQRSGGRAGTRQDAGAGADAINRDASIDRPR
jgi:hypothetical protein